MPKIDRRCPAYNSLEARRMYRIIVVLLEQNMLFFGILKLAIRRGQINFTIVFIFVSYRVQIRQLSFDCACTAGAAAVCKAKLGICWSMATMLCYVIVVVGRTRPRSMLLAMLTMKKELLAFPFLCMHVALFQ